MNKNPNSQIIAIDGGKKNPAKEDESAYIVIDGERINLQSFVLSGETETGSRCLLTYNVSPDELSSYVKILDVVVSKRIEKLMEIE